MWLSCLAFRESYICFSRVLLSDDEVIVYNRQDPKAADSVSVDIPKSGLMLIFR